jgi:hypothetical protein
LVIAGEVGGSLGQRLFAGLRPATQDRIGDLLSKDFLDIATDGELGFPVLGDALGC